MLVYSIKVGGPFLPILLLQKKKKEIISHLKKVNNMIIDIARII